MYKLRSHHINCLFFYRGRGYSDSFIKNMNEIYLSIKNNQEEKICLPCCDDLCKNCPNRRGNECIEEERVKSLDNKTLKEFSLELREYEYSYIINNIYTNYNVNKFEKICSECNWYKNGVCNSSIIEEGKNIWTKFQGHLL